MTMIRVPIGIDPVSGQLRYDLRHPFLAGARKRLLRVPDKHVTKKTRREVPAWRAVADGAGERGGYSARAFEAKQKKEK